MKEVATAVRLLLALDPLVKAPQEASKICADCSGSGKRDLTAGGPRVRRGKGGIVIRVPKKIVDCSTCRGTGHEIQDPLKKAGPQTYGLSMISPEGEVHVCGSSHPDWCHNNRHLVGFEGTRDGDYEPATGDEATFDDDERTALDHFKDAGWIRYKPNAGLEMSHIHPGNLQMVKKLLTGMGRQNPGRTLYVDARNNHRLPVDHRGRVDTSSLDQEAVADHY